MSEHILSVRDLRTYFKTDGGIVKAVDGVSFDLRPGETLGIVGESGSGKSVTNLSILQLIPNPPGYHPSGEAIYQGKNLLEASNRELCSIRGNKISMIFQDPMTSLNPFLTIERQLAEVLETHRNKSFKEARESVITMLSRVGIPDPPKRIHSYPHEFSGGMRQRVMIAMALLCRPELLIADEPTTALDVTIQAQILELLKDLQGSLNTSIILITHDLGVVAGMVDRILVMYAGRIVEEGRTNQIFYEPRHPYTQGLLQSVPRLDSSKRDSLVPIPGLPPDLATLPAGCPFAPRCSQVRDICRQEYPPITHFAKQHWAACWAAQESSPSEPPKGHPEAD